MPIPVHALAHRSLTTRAVAELVALPAAPHIPDEFDTLDVELGQRGWSWENELVESFRTAHGHVLCSDGGNPFGLPDVRHFQSPQSRPVGPRFTALRSRTTAAAARERTPVVPTAKVRPCNR